MSEKESSSSEKKDSSVSYSSSSYSSSYDYSSSTGSGSLKGVGCVGLIVIAVVSMIYSRLTESPPTRSNTQKIRATPVEEVKLHNPLEGLEKALNITTDNRPTSVREELKRVQDNMPAPVFVFDAPVKKPITAEQIVANAEAAASKLKAGGWWNGPRISYDVNRVKVIRDKTLSNLKRVANRSSYSPVKAQRMSAASTILRLAEEEFAAGNYKRADELYRWVDNQATDVRYDPD